MLAVDVRAICCSCSPTSPAVMSGFGTPDAAPLQRLTAQQAAGLELPAGSMGPKVDACVRFVTATDRPATIGALAAASALVAGTAGTTVVASGADPNTTR